MNPTDYFYSIKGNLVFDDFVLHGEAWDYLSWRGSDAKLKSIPQETRDKIANVYQKMRNQKFYHAGFDYEKKELLWMELIGPTEAYIRWAKRAERERNRAPQSLVEMEPPPNNLEPFDFNNLVGGIK